VLVWGAGGHALVVADILRLVGSYEIAGFLDDMNPERRGEEFGGATILGGAGILPRLRRAGVSLAIIAVGNCAARVRLATEAKRAGFRLAKAIHPRSVIAGDAVLKAGTVVAAGAVINPGAMLAENVIINTNASVDHECKVGQGAHISPGAQLAGRVQVGRESWIGIGASVIEGVKIGRRSVVGAGAVVLKNIPDGVIAYGVPAQVIRKMRG
jgi:UDP-N-acetylbacillosamine N-acetyltransferase